MQNIYTGINLASKCNVKDETSKKLKPYIIFKAQYPDLNCDATYTGEAGRSFLDHSGRDKSHLHEHAEKIGHENTNIGNLYESL